MQMNRRTTTRPAAAQQSSAKGSPATRRTGPISPRASSTCKHKQVVSANVLFVVLLLLIAGIYGLVVFAFYEAEVTPGSGKTKSKYSVNSIEEDRQKSLRGNQPVQVQVTKQQKTAVKPQKSLTKLAVERAAAKSGDGGQYSEWRDLAVTLAALPVQDLLKELKENDPFETRRFEQALLDKETELERLLEPSEIEALFPCPSSRITLPDQRNLQKSKDFRDDKPGTFLFFQHLRKGT